MPEDALSSPVYMFVNYVRGRRVRPGVIVSVIIYGTPPSFPDIRLETTVKMNSNCRTEYSAEVTLEDNEDRSWTNTSIGSAMELEGGRRAIILEMKARGESLGPAGFGEDEGRQDSMQPTATKEESSAPSEGLRSRSSEEYSSGESTEEEDAGDVKGKNIACRCARHVNSTCPVGCADHTVDDLYA
ncbi:hypothetical protein GSI_13691 [Ganoderma sinense ZZ0214-1]|uniref:Uncharacterized protein n=1 Tax=Ganoderma sinense ZZ0214-1 TaxID=1077348 RepID=A0A2G8RR00_9APHY|nr:hypothetical protein GSI_13691 [Ganoderma sinense ZZ0214-1]